MDDLLFVHCLFCRAPLPSEADPPGAGVRWAYDPAGSRAWTICVSCGRWNLVPPEARRELIDRLEDGVRRRGRLLAATPNIALLGTERGEVLRVGESPLAEQAWWRYGRVLRSRQARFRSAGARLTAYTAGALAYVGGRVGPWGRVPPFSWDATPFTDALRWWRFGSLAWVGASRCAHCRSVLRAFSFEDSWLVRVVVDPEGRPGIGVPCPRCDPWTPERLFRIVGDDTRLLLRRLLAYQNIAGGTDRMIDRAGRTVADAGTPERLAQGLAATGRSLRRLGPTVVLALEMALTDSAERAELRAEARALESAWRREDELARIVDEL